MKKTQKLLSLVVVLAFALSMCSISAFAAKQVVDSTSENIITDDFTRESAVTLGYRTAFTNAEGTVTARSHSGSATSNAVIDNGVLTVGNGTSGRLILEACNTDLSLVDYTSGVFTVSFKFMTPDKNPTVELNIYAPGHKDNFVNRLTTNVSTGVDKVGSLEIQPEAWYDFEATIDLDADTYVAKIGDETVVSAAYTYDLRRLIDTSALGARTIVYDDFVINKITQNYIEDGVTNYLYDDFNTAGTITPGTTQFKNAAGTNVATTASTANATKVDGYLNVGNGTSGRLHLTASNAPTTGTYTVSFRFRTPDVYDGTNRKANLFIYGNNLIGAGAIFAHSSLELNGKESIWVNNAGQYTIEPNTWYDFDCTMDLDAGTWVATVNDKIVREGTFTANTAWTLLVNYGQNNNSRTIQYDDFVINKHTKDYEVMNVTKANGTISARFVNNAAPKATFFAAIYENGALTSLKAITDTTNLAERTVGTYSAADENVEVKFFVFAKEGLMPLTDAE